MRATFFIVIGTNNPDRNIFGQPDHPEYKGKKLKQLTSWGMEVASHTYWHNRMSQDSPELVKYSLAKSYKELKELSGQEIVSLAAPMGLYPSDKSVFSSGYQKIRYNYKLVCEVSGGPQLFPSSPNFNPYHINRIQATSSEWKKFFNRKNQTSLQSGIIIKHAWVLYE
jgi:peptidoglycan/xylan/chitin deacetylase (PgdA/CDA1 family)